MVGIKHAAQVVLIVSQAHAALAFDLGAIATIAVALLTMYDIALPLLRQAH